MESVKMNIPMLCAYTGLSTEALADKANIDRNHLKAVRAGRVAATVMKCRVKQSILA